MTTAWMLLSSAGFGQPSLEDAAHRIFELTNQDRQAHGLPALRWDESLAAAAQTHDEWMIRQGSLSHQFPGEPELMERAAHASAHFQAIAENIALGPSAEAIEKQWMHSTPHRTNILDPQMNALGVAVMERNGSLYAVEDFAQASENLSVAQVEQRVSELLRAQNVNSSGPAAEAEEACRTADALPRGSRARAVIRFETPDLTQLPGQVAEEIRRGDFRSAAVGACAPRKGQGTFTVYRVAILFY